MGNGNGKRRAGTRRIIFSKERREVKQIWKKDEGTRKEEKGIGWMDGCASEWKNPWNKLAKS